MSELEQVMSRIDGLERVIRELVEPKLPGLTVSEFAAKTGLSVTTIHRRLGAGKIRRENGLIPYSQLRKYLS